MAEDEFVGPDGVDAKPDPDKSPYLRNVLPKMKLSELIYMGLEDIEEVERSGEYKIDMSYYHLARISRNRACAVCFAGSVMVQRLHVPEDHAGCDVEMLDDDFRDHHELSPGDFTDIVTAKQLRAMNDLRCGNVEAACAKLCETHGDIYPPAHLLDVPITDYNDDREEFKSDLRSLADELNKHGL